jgi:GNAT superfamily N-acetyltransferase
MATRRHKRQQDQSLAPGASTGDLIRAAVENHRQWFGAWARYTGGEVVRRYGVTCTHAADEITILFPRLASAEADRILDAILEECRARHPKTVSVWSTTPARPRDLGARLAARGFEWGWLPHWMAMDFRKLPAEPRVAADVSISVDLDCDWHVRGMPYYSRDGAERFRMVAKALPGRIFEVAARIGDEVVGHSAMLLSRGALGVAGIYNVGVLESHRRRGVGAALMDYCCRLAHSEGCHYATLNSAACEFYTSIGFDSLGWGQTWWMHRLAIEAAPPTRELLALITALGRGDVRRMRKLGSGELLRVLVPSSEPRKPDLPHSPDMADPGGPPSNLGPLLDRPLPNGMTPIGVARHAPRPGPVVEWLVDNGATLHLRDAWDLGWHDRIPELLARRPELVNVLAGPWKTTPLHDAVWRGDAAFVRLLLAHNPDLEIKDSEFNSTPLGWARHFARTEIIGLLEAHRRK